MPMLASFRLDADRIEHRHGVLAAELAAQDAGDREAAQHIVGDHADMHEIVRPRLGGGEALLEEVAPRVAGVRRRSRSPARDRRR